MAVRARPERLKDRLAWMIENMEVPAYILAELNKFRIEGIVDIVGSASKDGAIQVVLGGEAPSTSQLYAVLNGSATLTPTLLSCLKEIFPSATTELLNAPEFKRFREIADEIDSLIQPWQNATREVAKNRGQLARRALEYYSDVNEAPDDLRDFPLVTKKEWILETPFLLEKETNISEFDPNEPDIEGKPLFYGGPNFRPIKQTFIALKAKERKRAKIVNGLTYRLLRHEVSDNCPHFTFGPGN